MPINAFTRIPDSPNQLLQINFHHKSVKGEFKLFKIVEEQFKILFIPSLNLSGYGSNDEEALEMLKDSLDTYFNNLFKLKNDRVLNELGLLGWKQDRIHHKRFNNVAYVDKEGILRNFNLPAETEIEESSIAI
jgi:hypothetical protein